MNATISAITAYNKYGLGKNLIRHYLEKQWVIPTEIRDAYSRYYLLYWSGHYILEKLQDGIITHNGVRYITHLAPRLSRNILANHSEKQFPISFRTAQPEYELDAIALIGFPSSPAFSQN